MSNPITYRTALEVAHHEAIVRQAYKDSVGVWTWSVGLTNATGHNVERYIGKPQTMEHCLRIYVWALDRYADAVRKSFAGHTLTEAQFAAALSFHWNTGRIGSASWVAAFKRRDLLTAEASFRSWNKAGGRVSDGLINRRASEADLLFRGKWANADNRIAEYGVIASSTPNWSSLRRVNIEADLRAALAKHNGEADEPIIDHDPDPDAPVTLPVTGGEAEDPFDILARIEAETASLRRIMEASR